jgi:hypothetical protein
MKATTKIRFTEGQIALVLRAYPNCNLGHLTEVCFEFDKSGKIIDCIGTTKDGGTIDNNYVGSGLRRLYDRARLQLTARQTGATILQFPNGAKHHMPLSFGSNSQISNVWRKITSPAWRDGAKGGECARWR